MVPSRAQLTTPVFEIRDLQTSGSGRDFEGEGV